MVTINTNKDTSLLLLVSEFDLRSFLCSESEQLIWKSQGLPSDDLSMENALVILQVRLIFQICIYNVTQGFTKYKH